MNAYEPLLETAESLPIIDTHEHLPREADWAKAEHDVLCEYLRHYFRCDLVSAGLPPETMDRVVTNPELPLMERWEAAAPYWNAARHTGYGRSLDIAARDLYDLPGVTAETIEELDRRFRQAREQAASGEQSHYRTVLKDASGIAVSLVDGRTDCDRAFFRGVYRLDHYMAPKTTLDFAGPAERLGHGIHSLADWEAACEAELDWALGQGVVALKSGAAYWRSLHYPKVTRHEAEEAFVAFFNREAGPTWRPVRHRGVAALQNHMMHHILTLADRRGLTFQFHTGLQEGNGNHIANSNPERMTNLFLEYANVTFDIFHIGYPYQRTLGALAKNFRNVMIDMCWAQIISPEASVRAMVEWIDSVPANKISAFGGDYVFIDGVCGHSRIARRNVARALAIKVDQGLFDLDRAKQICRWWFVDNPKRIFGLDL